MLGNGMPRLVKTDHSSDTLLEFYTPASVGGCWRPSVPGSKSALNPQVRFPMSAANEMQNETHQGHHKKNMNQHARYMKNDPGTNPGNH